MLDRAPDHLPGSFARLSVLVVDDDELVRTVMQRMLEQVGVGGVHVAESARAALGTAAQPHRSALQ